MGKDVFREKEKEDHTNPIKTWDFITDLILFLFIILLAFIIIKPFLTALLFALLTAYSLKPLVDIIKKVVRFYVLSLIITLLIILIPVGIFVYYAAIGAGGIVEKTNEIMFSLNSLIYLASYKASEIPILKALDVPQHILNLRSLVGEVISSLKISLINVFQNIPRVLIGVFIYLISTYYFIVESDILTRHYERLLTNLSEKRQVMLNAIFKGLKNSLDVLVVSYITLTIIISVLAYIIFFAFSIPYALIWAILAGLFSLLPILGTWMVYGGVSLYLYIKGDLVGSVVVLVYGLIVLNILPDVVLRPLMGSYKGNVHPLIIILGFFGGPIIFGVSGFILGPIILVVGATVIKEYYNYYILHRDSLHEDSEINIKEDS